MSIQTHDCKLMLLCGFVLAGCLSQSSSRHSQDEQGSNGTALRPWAVKTRGVTARWQFNERAGKLEHNDNLPANETLVAYARWDLFTSAGTMLQVDVNEPYFVQESLVEAVGDTNSTAQEIPVAATEAIWQCPLQMIGRSARLESSGDTASGLLDVVAFGADYNLVRDARQQLRWLSAECVASQISQRMPVESPLPTPSSGSVAHVPYNQNEPIQLGWDYESMTPDIVNYYRPSNMTDQQWEHTSSNDKMAALLAELARVSQRGDSSKETAFELIQPAPVSFLPRFLQAESQLYWEVYTTEPVDSLFALRSQIDQMSSLNLGRLNVMYERGLLEAGYHFHITFPTSGMPQEFMKHLAATFMYLNEGQMHHALQHAFNPLQAQTVPAFTAATLEEYNGILQALRSPSHVREDFAQHEVGFRTLASYSTAGKRFGFEVRWGNHVNKLATTELVFNALQDPGGLHVRSSHGVIYYVGDLKPQYYLNRTHLNNLPIDVKRLIRAAVEAVDPARYVKHLDLLWAAPMVEWEMRPSIVGLREDKRTPIVATIRAARDTYKQRLKELVTGPDKEEVADEIAKALQSWAQTVKLDQHYFRTVVDIPNQ